MRQGGGRRQGRLGPERRSDYSCDTPLVPAKHKLWTALLAVVLTACGAGETVDQYDTAGAASETVQSATTVPAPPSTTVATTAPTDGVSKSFAGPPDLTIDTAAQYTATITTNLGDIVVSLFADTAPNTVNNFVFLANEGYYDGVIFHRVIPGFVAQAGDPTGTGRGGPGYTFADELNDPLPYTRGILAMANAGPNTNGSQFFIVHEDVGLPYAYTIFGEVISGMDVVDAIAATPTGPGDRPTTDIIIESITVDET